MIMTDTERCYGVFTLSTGKTLKIVYGVLGIRKVDHGDGDYVIEATTGYDDTLAEVCDVGTLTPAERQEIADYMTGLWQEWARLQE